ncbi:MAG: oxalurate catabolism protein HpxZ [Roseobacter sp.]
MRINIPEVLEEVTAAFNTYETALMDNDVATLDGLFWSSPHVIRYGATENLHGHDAILAFRKNRSSTGLQRSLQHTVITTFGQDYATANTEFTRTTTPRIGRQSHSWARTPDGWKIVAAHVSLMDSASPPTSS